MTDINILKAVKLIKVKNSEGHDRTPQRLIIDGIELLLKPLSKLFNNIYVNDQIPEQWKLSKITTVHKKGAKSNVENYRPVANLCSATKIYERMILELKYLFGELFEAEYTYLFRKLFLFTK